MQLSGMGPKFVKIKNFAEVQTKLFLRLFKVTYSKILKLFCSISFEINA